ncbi:MAG: redoxin domain-containing protein [Chloroflexi bacterium]|nr:redoxin domain-containing protein [Chloroflexota bacterium]
MSLINQPAPSFSLPVLGGGRVSLADLRGRIAIINFWSAECPWSRRADLVLLYRHNAWSRAGVKIVGISSTSNEPENELIYEADVRHIKYPLAIDVTREVANAYKAERTPHFFVLDQKSIVRYVGALDDATENRRTPKTIYLDRAINALLNNRNPAPAVTPVYGSAIFHK